MAMFVTIGGGKIKRAKGRFGGEPRLNRLDLLVKATYTRFKTSGATAIDDGESLDFGFAWKHSDRPERQGKRARRRWLDQHRFGNWHVDDRPARICGETTSTAGYEPGNARLSNLDSITVDVSEPGPRVVRGFPRMHNDRATRAYSDGMRIQSARF
jgi:hypothetical protein